MDLCKCILLRVTLKISNKHSLVIHLAHNITIYNTILPLDEYSLMENKFIFKWFKFLHYFIPIVFLSIFPISPFKYHLHTHAIHSPYNKSCFAIEEKNKLISINWKIYNVVVVGFFSF